MNMPNYYDTLNVARTASLVEILASYNILKKMFGADPAMASELDEAVAVLRDEASRKAYDKAIVEAMNKRAARSQVPVELPPLPVEKIEKVVDVDSLIAFDRRDRTLAEEMKKDLTSKILKIACSVAIVGSMLFAISSNPDILSRVGFLGPEDFTKTEFVRPATAPNGQAFPEVSAYLNGYEVLENTGKSSLNIQNTKGESDVYLKLISHKDGKAGVARHVFVKAGSDFVVDKLSPGKYEIQYLDLKVGSAGRSELFEVTEGKTALGGDEVSRLSVRLKTAVNGVLRVEKVTAEEFNSVASL